MKKVLIYLQEGQLAKTGGQIGYNYALKQQLDKMGITHIHFLPGGVPFQPGLGKKIKNTWYGGILKSVKDFFRWTYAMHKNELPPVDLNEYDIVHFHGCHMMYYCRKALENYRGKVLLTSHTPRVSYQEIKSMLTPWGQKHMSWYYNQMVKFDRYAFSRADYIVFPCPEAEEPYFNTWPEFASIKQNRSDRFRYVLTGTYECQAKLSRHEICAKFNIPDDAFIVCYVGRHNDVKGYDQLKLIGEKILQQNPNAFMLVAGEEWPLKGLEHPRWIEVGWTNDPHSIIAASDVFVLPNKETYFDLILLEVLSLGKIVVASNTGGNKYFKGKLDNGFCAYEGIDEAVDCLSKVCSLEAGIREDLGKKNMEFFREELSLQAFGKNYVDLYNQILAE